MSDLPNFEKLLAEAAKNDTRTDAEKKAATEKYLASRISAKVPLENIVDNGHRFLIGKKPWDEGLRYDPDIEVEVFGNRASEDDEGHIHVNGAHMRCHRCGAFMRFSYDEDNNTLTATGERFEYEYEEKEGRLRAIASTRCSVLLPGPCEVALDIEPVIRLAVPSGQMIVDDSLREVYDPRFEDVDYNSILGQVVAIQRNAEVGCAYGPVGNSCPSVYLRPDGTYVIGNPAWDRDKNDFDTTNGWVEKAGILTDLWAYSIADYDDWLAKGGAPVEPGDKHTTRAVIDVAPGVYEFRYYRGREDFVDDSSVEVVYADFRLIE